MNFRGGITSLRMLLLLFSLQTGAVNVKIMFKLTEYTSVVMKNGLGHSNVSFSNGSPNKLRIIAEVINKNLNNLVEGYASRIVEPHSGGAINIKPILTPEGHTLSRLNSYALRIWLGEDTPDSSEIQSFELPIQVGDKIIHSDYSPPTITTPTTTTDVTTTSTNDIVCPELGGTSCSDWASAGRCLDSLDANNDGVIDVNFMQKYCRASCNQCNDIDDLIVEFPPTISIDLYPKEIDVNYFNGENQFIEVGVSYVNTMTEELVLIVELFRGGQSTQLGFGTNYIQSYSAGDASVRVHFIQNLNPTSPSTISNNIQIRAWILSSNLYNNGGFNTWEEAYQRNYDTDSKYTTELVTDGGSSSTTPQVTTQVPSIATSSGVVNNISHTDLNNLSETLMEVLWLAGIFILVVYSVGLIWYCLHRPSRNDVIRRKAKANLNFV